MGDASKDNSLNDIRATLGRAMALHQAGRLADAEQLYNRVLSQNPRQFDALHFFGVLEAQRGRFEQARRLIGTSLQVGQPPPEAFCNHARVLIALKRYEEAIASCNQALARNPGLIDALVFHGNALRALRRSEEALASFGRVLAIRPDYIPALVGCGDVLGALGRFEEALARYNSALRAAPQALEALNGRGCALHKLNRFDDALASFDRALHYQPDCIEALINRGFTLHEVKRFEEALQCYDKALQLKPDHVEALINRGCTLHELKRFEQALQCYDKALRIEPDRVDALTNRGLTLEALDRYDEADQHYDRALDLDPNFANAQWNKFLRCMHRGQLAEGWKLYHSRWTANVANRRPPRPYTQPIWTGGHVDGALLVWGEQGLGDQILHASMLADVKTHADTVVLEVEHRLVPLFARSFPDMQVVALKDELYRGPVSAQIAIGGLGGHLRNSWDAFSAARGRYLAADASHAAKLRERLKCDNRTVIGLSWRSVSDVFGSRKSAELRDFESILRLPGCRFVDLQYGDTAAERKAIERELGVLIEKLDDIDNTNDIDGLAALVTACDLVVSVSNTTAHLAGALGKTTWVLVPFGYGRLWYWFNGRDDSPWYPDIRLRRQGRGQSWAQLISSEVANVAACLSAGR